MRAMDWLRYVFPFLLALAMSGLRASATCPPGECAARSRLCPQKELNAIINAMRNWRSSRSSLNHSSRSSLN